MRDSDVYREIDHMTENIKAASNIHAGDGGYSVGNEEDHRKFVDLRNRSLMRWVDPPEGWRYGFPKIYHPINDGDLIPWILKCGYPEAVMKSYGDYFYIRQWNVDNLNEKENE